MVEAGEARKRKLHTGEGAGRPCKHYFWHAETAAAGRPIAGVQRKTGGNIGFIRKFM